MVSLGVPFELFLLAFLCLLPVSSLLLPFVSLDDVQFSPFHCCSVFGTSIMPLGEPWGMPLGQYLSKATICCPAVHLSSLLTASKMTRQMFGHWKMKTAMDCAVGCYFQDHVLQMQQRNDGDN
jgi:hypothetical protein